MKTIDVERLSHQLSKLIKEESDLAVLLDRASHVLAEFGKNNQWFYQVVRERLFQDASLFNTNSIWPNEMTIWRSPEKDLSLFAYTWDPLQATPIHDHGAWGVVSATIQPCVEHKYQRVDNGSKEGFAELKKVISKTLEPGETTVVLPMDRGIHQLENTTDKYMVSLSVFGRPVRSGYLQFYYPKKRKVERVYPPKIHRQVLAIRVLETMAESQADELLKDVLNKDLPGFIKDECRLSLKRRS